MDYVPYVVSADEMIEYLGVARIYFKYHKPNKRKLDSIECLIDGLKELDDPYLDIRSTDLPF